MTPETMTPETSVQIEKAQPSSAPATGSAASAGKYVLKKHSPERDYICAISHLDRAHKCDSMGELSMRNAYGELFHISADYPDGLPVICGHGGSLWLCRKCCDEIMQQQNDKLKNAGPRTPDVRES